MMTFLLTGVSDVPLDFFISFIQAVVIILILIVYHGILETKVPIIFRFSEYLISKNWKRGTKTIEYTLFFLLFIPYIGGAILTLIILYEFIKHLISFLISDFK